MGKATRGGQGGGQGNVRVNEEAVKILTWADRRDGWVVAGKIAAAMLAGRKVRVASRSGYFIDGIFWSADCLRDPLGRPWIKS